MSFSGATIAVLAAAGLGVAAGYYFRRQPNTVRDGGGEDETAAQALRDSEERYLMLVESLPDAVLVANTNHEVVFANTAAAGLFGAAQRDRLIGMSLLDFVIPEDRGEVAEIIALTMQGMSTPMMERRRLRIDGSEFDSDTMSIPISWDGQPAILVSTRDVTGRKQTEAQLRQSQKMEAVGQLTGGVAHDFNNLLAVVLGNAELLKEIVDEDGLIDPVIRAATRGSDLTRKLLAFSSPQETWRKTVDLNELLDGMTGVLRRTLTQAIEINTVIGESLWPVRADESQLENLILNLAINARNAMLEGGMLTIETANAALDMRRARELDVLPGDYATLTVTDTGSGMTADVLEHVFEPFFTTHEVGEASGLGLSMAYAFARQSGGQLAIESDVGRGTVVTLYLPRETEAEEAVQAGDSDTQNFNARGETVLVVEDEPDMRQIAVSLLNDLGYQVLQAEHGAEAVATLKTEARVDLLLTDLVLPGGMSGAEIALEGRGVHPGIKVLIMSGYNDAGGKPEQPLEFLRKPFTRDLLARTVREALDGKGAEL